MREVIYNVDDDKILGLHIVGRDAGEIMQGFGAAVTCGVTKQQLFDTVCIHPSTAEASTDTQCCAVRARVSEGDRH